MIGGTKGAAAKLGLNHTTLINKMCRKGFPGPLRDVMERAREEVVAQIAEQSSHMSIYSLQVNHCISHTTR